MKLFVIAALAAVAVAAPANEWAAWKAQHGKTYASAGEESARMAIWLDNVERINTHNKAGKSFTMAMNHFGDMTHTEFLRLFTAPTMNLSNRTRSGATYMHPQNVELPRSVDWRSKGIVTGVKNQGQCGSCWAFSTTGSLEGQHALKTGNLVSLSEQNLVDCSGKFGNQGCNGGMMDDAFDYIKANNGIDTEASYQYTAQDGSCKFNPSTVGATLTGHTDVQSGSESDLQSASATVGPISVAIDASHQSFQFYSGGVYDEPACSSTQLDHGVLVVGYGYDGLKPYWLVKNSWGPSWGMNGYIQMTRNGNNQCGIATSASYPLV